MTNPTCARLRELLHYDQESGIFTWVGRASHSVAAIGDEAGSADNGYIRLCIDGQRVLAHRAAFLWMTGRWPERAVDHINGCRSDNRWANLRDVSARTNSENLREPTAASTTGYLGVSYSKKRNKFQAMIKTQGKSRFLGRFNTAEEAHQAYLTAKRKLHEGCTL